MIKEKVIKEKVIKEKVITNEQLREQTRRYVTDLYKDINDNNRRCFDFGGPDISINFETINGVVQPHDCNSQYGNVILNDEESTFLVNEMMEQGFISPNQVGFLEVEPNKMVLS